MPVLFIGGIVAAIRKSVGAVWLAEPPKRPSLRLWLGRFLFDYFCALKRCLAPHGACECARCWSYGRQGKPSKCGQGVSEIQYDRASVSDILPIILLFDRADPRVKRAQNVRRQQKKHEIPSRK
jgi:hypothetical protein